MNKSNFAAKEDALMNDFCLLVSRKYLAQNKWYSFSVFKAEGFVFILLSELLLSSSFS